jgi:hypothetical protein
MQLVEMRPEPAQNCAQRVRKLFCTFSYIPYTMINIYLFIYLFKAISEAAQYGIDAAS